MSIKETISNQIKTHSTILGNMASLGLLQVANYLIPIAVFPFITRILGVEMIGRISYAQNIIQYFTIIITFGFEYSATREIAIHKNDKEKVSQIFWSVIATKTILLAFSFLCLLVLSVFWGRVQEDLPLYLCLFGVNIGFTYFPTWFFQGIEEMKGMSFINFLIKLFGMGLSVFFIHSPEDYLVYAYFPSLSYTVFGVAAFIYVIKKYEIKRCSSIRSEIVNQNSKSFPIFLNTFFQTLYTTANVTILGFFVCDYEVGIYAGAHKIIMCILMVTSMPINIAIYPSVGRKMAESKAEGLRYLKQVARYVVGAALVVSLLSLLFSPLMVKILLGDQFGASIPLLRVFCCMPLLVITASLCTVQGLYGLGYQRYAPWMGLGVGTVCILANLQFIPLWGVYGAALSWIIAEVLEICVSGGIVMYFSAKRGFK